MTACVQGCGCSGDSPRKCKQPRSTHGHVPFLPLLTVILCKDFIWWLEASVISGFYQECYVSSRTQIVAFTGPRSLYNDTPTLWQGKQTSTFLRNYVLSGCVCSTTLSQIFYRQYWMPSLWSTFSIHKCLDRLAEASLDTDMHTNDWLARGEIQK